MIPEKFISEDFLITESGLDFGFYEVTIDSIIGYIVDLSGRKRACEWDRFSLADRTCRCNLSINIQYVKSLIKSSSVTDEYKCELIDLLISYYEEQIEYHKGE